MYSIHQKKFIFICNVSMNQGIFPEMTDAQHGLGRL